MVSIVRICRTIYFEAVSMFHSNNVVMLGKMKNHHDPSSFMFGVVAFEFVRALSSSPLGPHAKHLVRSFRAEFRVQTNKRRVSCPVMSEVWGSYATTYNPNAIPRWCKSMLHRKRFNIQAFLSHETPRDVRALPRHEAETLGKGPTPSSKLTDT